MRPWVPVVALALALAPLAVVRPCFVRGRSMAPALEDGQVWWVVRAWATHAPRRGEVWLLDGPAGPTVKRVLGLPGEQLVWRGPDLWVDGRRLEEPWVHHPEREGGGSQACAEGYLVLGDNRPESEDGRRWGPLPRRTFTGRVVAAPGFP